MHAKAVILAAGKGTRLQSEASTMPKVMRMANERPLIHYVAQGLSFLAPQDVIIVVGYKKDKVIESFTEGYHFVEQEQQLGTAHAVEQAIPLLQDYDGPVLVCFGDMPLLTKATYQDMLQRHIDSGADCTVLTAIVDPPPRYGRIFRDEQGAFKAIVEDHDLTPEQKGITEVNVGINVFDNQKMLHHLKEIGDQNNQKERYLPWLPGIFVQHGYRVNTYTVENNDEIWGVNTPEDLAFAERMLKQRD